ncbi:hypothetical protein [Kribbella sp. NPDC004875]|uniref:hypothetical protein n=1 Tax=Kribbella sp. NPDC004875 TaxID=3364107 RepID=UPI0036BC0B49
MEHSSRAWIARRLRSLATLELLNIPLQYVVWFGVIDLPGTAPNLAGFALFALLLAQGAAYWSAKLRQLPGEPLPAARWFSLARKWNVPVLAGGLVFVLAAVARDPGATTVAGLVFAVVAVLEYVNYFHLQLMHDTPADLRYLFTRGLRRSHLARDLARAAASR